MPVSDAERRARSRAQARDAGSGSGSGSAVSLFLRQPPRVCPPMSAVRTPWHVYFAIFLKEHAPPDIQLKFELILTTEPQRGDLLLLRRGDAGHRDHEAQAFRGLWPLLRTETLVEF